MKKAMICETEDTPLLQWTEDMIAELPPMVAEAARYTLDCLRHDVLDGNAHGTVLAYAVDLASNAYVRLLYDSVADDFGRDLVLAHAKRQCAARDAAAQSERAGEER